jgi:ATP/maltotriose-dependent transcriptional regulator MalT/DNA-binding SARP family transcriptional activator
MFSEYGIIRTRVTAPRRRGELVTRPRLNKLLSELIEKRLVLVSAPAGYGKTSLLVDFVSECQLPVCWYTIDRLDFDPLQFIAFFAAAIHNRFPKFGQRTIAALSSAQGQVDVDFAATILINEIYDTIPEHFLLVLDDYHLVNDSLQVRHFISRFLQDAEENCHLVITSRTLLSLPDLPVMAARSEVGGISFEELAFTTEEIQKLYKQSQSQKLSDDIAEDIRNRSEGWVTGIVLASQVKAKGSAAHERLARVSRFGLDDYFLQLINQLPADLRAFLLRSSLLEEFDTNRCSQVLGLALGIKESPWLKWMNAIQQNNLFAMPVGEDGDWLRYHPLFLEFLQTQIFRENPQEARTIEKCLAQVCIQNSEWDRAFSIYRRLDLPEELVKLIETAEPDIITGGRVSTLSAWLDALPSEILNTRPFIIALQGYVAMALGDNALALTLYNQAVGAMKLPEDKVHLARTLAMRARLQYLKGQLDGAISDANECMQLISNDLGQRKVMGEAMRCIGLCHYLKGKLQEALTWLGDALNIMLSVNDHKNEAVINLEMGLAYENLGDYTHSKEKYTYALNYWQQVENPVWLSNLYNNLGVLEQMMGDYEQAIQSFDKALEYARSCNYIRMEAYVLTGIADIYAELQADEQATQIYQMASMISDRSQEHFLQVYINVQAAALAGQGGDFVTGYQLIQKAQELVAPQGSEMEYYLCELEFCGLKILENKANEIIPRLENTCSYFVKEGHKVQHEKAHLYLMMAYQTVKKPEKIIENFLHIITGLDGEYAPVSLISTAARHQTRLSLCKVNYLHDELVRFHQEIDHFQEKRPSLRRYLRENARAVPLAPPTLYIRSLGRMQVQINKHVVTNSDWQTQAARDLFFMLLAKPEGMTKEEVSLIFWPDGSPEEVKFRFKNTVYRLRRALGKNTVILEQDIYRFNNSLDYEYDVEQFLKECVLANQAKDHMQKLAHFREAIKHYRGNYLSEIDETWVLAAREYLRQNYLNILMQVSKSYLDLSNYDLAQEYCQRLLLEDNLLEDAHRLALQIYAAMGNRAGLVRQYQRCVEILEREINAAPSLQTQKLYQDLLR